MQNRWFEVYAFPLGNDQVGLLFTDISERQRAEATLRESEAYKSFVLTLRDRLSQLTAPTDITAAAAELLGLHLQVNGVIYAEVDETAEYAMIWSGWTDGTVPRVGGRYRLDDFGVGDLYRAGGIRRIDDMPANLTNNQRAHYEASQFRASVGVPLFKGHRLVAIIATHSAAPRRWTDAEVSLIQDVGARIVAEIERARAEFALHQSEEQFRLLTIATADVVYKMSPDWNEMRHLDGKNFIVNTDDPSQTWLETYIPREDHPQVLATIEEAIQTKSLFEMEHRIIQADGSVGWIFSRAIALLDAEHNIMEWLGTARNVTERKQAEMALRQSEERFRKALEIETVGVIFFDPDGAITSANEAFLRMGNYSRADIEAARLRWDTLTPPEWMPASWRAIEEFKAHGQTTPYEKEYYRPDGSRWWGLFAAKRLSEHEGVEFIIDMTTRKQAEQRMQMLQQLAADLSARLTVHDMGRSILQACCEVVGGAGASLYRLLSEPQVLERVFTDGIPQTIQAPHQRLSLDILTPLTDAIHTRQIIWGSTQADYIQRYPHLHDAIVHHNVHAYIALPLVLEQRIQGAIAISFSEPKSLSREEQAFLIAVAHLCAQALERAQLYEIEKEAREAAEKATALKMQFLGMVSHELRTPLAAIKGFTSTLLAKDVTFTPEEQQQFLSVVDQETDKLTDLVGQLLDLTRLQAGTLRLNVSPHTLEEIVTIAQIQLGTLTTRHHLVIELPDDLLSVLVDPQRVAQVLVNLVGNATKFSPQQSTITIRALQEQEVVRVDVSDEGLGIPPVNRIEVFEAFRQIERLTTNHDPGAGLGLAICKGIIEAHGGQIWVQDRDQGTTISLTLPIVTREETP